MANNTLSISVVLSAYFVVSLCLFFPHSTTALYGGDEDEQGGNVPVPVPATHGTVVKKDQRWSVVKAEFGEISAVKVNDGRDGFYHLQFITMEPNSLFLPVHLHSDMVFYVDSGSGTLSWVDLEKKDDKLQKVELRTGDVYRLRTGSFFYLQSNLDSDRRKLRVHAIFSDSKEEIREGSSFGAYSSVRDLVLGFDDKVLQAALAVDNEVIQELRSGERQPMIVHGVTKGEVLLDIHYRIMRAFLGRMKNEIINVNKKSKDKDKAYNILEAKRDVENCNGWSLVVTSKQLDALKDSDFSVFLVNLTKGAMMGPHWNPMTAEIAVVLRGRGMVHVVCPSTTDETQCKNSRFRVEEGDVFVVPRYHPMTQISFNNGSFVFMGFTTTQKNNHPQYLVGSASVFQVLDKRVLATSLGVSNTTMDEILSAQREAIILECISCAEEEERLMEDEIQREEEAAREKEEEERKKEEEEARKREEEEAARKEKEEEARRQREQEEAERRAEEEAARQAQEETERQKREQEEAERQAEEEAERQRREQEEAERQAEEEAARQEEAERQKREQEEAERQAEEEAARQAEEEAERQRREQEEAERQRREQEEAARQKRVQEEQAARQQEEEAARQDEESRQKREQEEEAAWQQQKQKQEEVSKKRQQEEEAARHEQKEEAAQQEGEAAQSEEEARQKREQEEEVARRRQEVAAEQQQEEARRWHQEEKEASRDQRWRHEEAAKQQQEEEAARQQEEARWRQQVEEEETHSAN